MKTLWSPLVSDCSGAVGDVVAARNRYGSYLRLRNGPGASGSPFWQAIKDVTHSFSVLWASVPLENKLLWSQASNKIFKSYAFGTRSTLPGYNYYISCNVNLSLCGLPPLALPPVHQPVNCLLSNSVTYAALTTNLVYDASLDNVVDRYVKIFSTKSIGLGRSSIINDYRLLAVVPAVDCTSLDLYSDYVARFGGSPASGCRLFFRSVVFDSVACSQSVPYFSNCLT